jgi:hypothetical protein
MWLVCEALKFSGVREVYHCNYESLMVVGDMLSPSVKQIVSSSGFVVSLKCKLLTSLASEAGAEAEPLGCRRQRHFHKPFGGTCSSKHHI